MLCRSGVRGGFFVFGLGVCRGFFVSGVCMSFCGYGLVVPAQAIEYVVAVCDLLGHGENGCAVQLLLETAAQETHLGRYRDPTPSGAGRGLFQCDTISFTDVQQRARRVDVDAVRQRFGLDIAEVQHCELDSSPLLAAIFCRLHYKFFPEAIPVTVEQRGSYWKRLYNTTSGRGTVADYVRNASRYIEF